MASEDSDQVSPRLSMVHLLRDLSDLDETLSGEVLSIADEHHAPAKSLEIPVLRGHEPMLIEERNDRLEQLVASRHDVLGQVLPMVVVAPIDVEPPDPEELL